MTPCRHYNTLRQWKIVTVEPVIFLCCFAAALIFFTSQLYIINQYQAEMLVASVSKNSSDARCRDLAYPNRSFVCITNDALNNCTNSTNGDVVEERSNTLILVTNMASTIPSVLVALVCGPISDRVGRRPLMLALTFFGSLSAAVFLIVMHFRLDIHYLVLVAFVNSLGGGLPGLLTASFSYITDFSSGKWMTYRIGFAECMLFLGAGLSYVLGGVWLKSSDCYYPYMIWLVLASYLATGIYILLYLPESLDRTERLRRHALSGHPSGFRSILRGLEIVFMPGHSRWRLWSFLYVLGVIYFIATGVSAVTTLYFSNPPLQWGPDLIGYYSIMAFTMHGAALVFLLPILIALKVHDAAISFVGLSFSAVMAVLNIFVKETWQMFTSKSPSSCKACTSPCLCLSVGILVSIEAIAAPPIRSMVSKSVHPSDKGIQY